MVVAAYTVDVDLDGSELFSETGEPIIAAVSTNPPGRKGAQLFGCTRGHDQTRILAPPRAGGADFILDNIGAAYGISSNLQAGKRTRFRAAYGGTTYELHRGVMDRPQQIPSLDFQKLVSCKDIGTFSGLAGKQIGTALYSSVTTDVALGYILDAVSWPKNFAPYVLGLSPAGQWSLGEASGSALDTSGNANNGAVTLGAGSRDYAALDDAGDGCIDFDGAATLVTITDAAAIQNIFDGGGAIAALINIDSDGEGAVGRVLDKSAWFLNVQNFAGGLVRLNFRHGFSGTQGIWQSAVNVPISTSLLVVVVYNNSNVANDPTIYLFNLSTEAFSTLTVGSGLTETSTPVGTRTTDVASNLIIGNNAAGGATFDGRLDEVAVVSAAAGLTSAQAKVMAARAKDAPRHLDVGKTTLDWWWCDNQDAFAAAVELRNTEGPMTALYEDGTGAIVFKNRHARVTESRSTAIQTTFRTSGAEPWIDLPFVYDPGIKDVVNACTIEVKTRATQALQAVWSLGSTVSLAPGESRSYVARGGQTQDTTTGQYVSIFTAAVVPSSGAGDFTVSAGSVSSVTLDRTSGAQVTITLTAGASGATVTGLRLRAQPVTVSATTTVTNTVSAAASQAQYGVQTYRLPTRAEIPVNTAQDFVNAVVGFYDDGRPTATIALMANGDAARMTASLAREIGDRVRVIEENVPIDAEFYVEQVQHQLFSPATHMTRFGLEKATSTSYFILDTSTLDGADVIGF